MTNQSVYIVGARRTPIGSLNGALSGLSAHQLGSHAIAAALTASGLPADAVEEVIMGQVLTAGAGMNPARQSARAAAIPDSAPAMTINQVCGSGLRAIALAAQQIALGERDLVIAGGQESMSNAPHVAVLRRGAKLGEITLADTVLRDGLTDAFFGYPMGNTAENIAEKYGITRAAQDAFALASQQKASAADRAGRFETEIAPIVIPGRKGDTTIAKDEYIRHDATLDAMARLSPAFVRTGSVTAANSSGINDGAAALVLASKKAARNAAPLARIAGWAHVGLDPAFMGLGPIPAVREALRRADWQIKDVDLFEINEAFAAQSLAVVTELGIDFERVNVNGGAIALGHPIGASGARILTTLVHELIRHGARRGVASLCIGGGMGIAMAIERL